MRRVRAAAPTPTRDGVIADLGAAARTRRTLLLLLGHRDGLLGFRVRKEADGTWLAERMDGGTVRTALEPPIAALTFPGASRYRRPRTVRGCLLRTGRPDISSVPDDAIGVVVFAPDPPAARAAIELLRRSLAKVGLELNDAKTRVIGDPAEARAMLTARPPSLARDRGMA